MAAEKMTSNTASISKNFHCAACGWPVIHACVNWDRDKFPDSERSDWWGYCSNKACAHHHGEDWALNGAPSFFVRS